MRDTRPSQEPPAQAPSAAIVRRSRSSFEAFYDKYDALIGLLCLSAREGVNAVYERQYSDLRVWFVRRYPSAKKDLVPHLDFDDADCYFSGSDRVECDAFEALYLPKTIGSMFDHDGGALIERMMRTQSALGAWDDAVASAEAACRLQVAHSEFRQAPIPAF